MKAALADATVDVLVEQGWAAVTVVEVCRRVGVTRGAFHHHYDGLPDLIADALGRLYLEMKSPERPEPTSLVEAIEGMWASIGRHRFKAVLEAWLALANDPSLGARIGPVVMEFAALVNPAKNRTLLADVESREFYLTAREAMLGLALGRAANGGRALGHEELVLDRLRREAAALDRRVT